MFAAKVQQKNELTKYFGKKVQILYKKTKKQGSERSDEVPAFTLYTLHLTPYTKQGSERSDEVPAFNLSPFAFNLKNSKLKT